MTDGVKYLKDALGFPIAADLWAKNVGLMTGNNNLAVLVATNNLSDLDDADVTRTNLGLTIGTDVQAYSPSLVAYATGPVPSSFITSTFVSEDAASFREAISAGTVLSVAALTIGKSGGDITSSVANSGTTPVITLNIPDASLSSRGALLPSDFSMFSSKQDALVSGANLKTIGGVTLLGSGNVAVVTTNDLNTKVDVPDSFIGVTRLKFPEPEPNKTVAWDAFGQELINISPALNVEIFVNEDQYVGDAVVTEYALTIDPMYLNNLEVFVGGLRLTKAIDYQWDKSAPLQVSLTAAPALDKVVLIRIPTLRPIVVGGGGFSFNNVVNSSYLALI